MASLTLMMQPTPFMGMRQRLQILPQMQPSSQQFYNGSIPQGPSCYSSQSMYNPSSGACPYQSQQPQHTLSAYPSVFHGSFGSMYNPSSVSGYQSNPQGLGMYPATNMTRSFSEPYFPDFSQQFINTSIPQGPSSCYSPQSMQNAAMRYNACNGIYPPYSGPLLYQPQHQQPQHTLSAYPSVFHGSFGSMYTLSNSQAIAMHSAPSMPHRFSAPHFPVGTAGLQPPVPQAQSQQLQQGMMRPTQPMQQGQQMLVPPPMQQLSDLEKGRKLGSGGLGTVYVWKRKSTGEEIAGKEVELQNANNLFEEANKIKQLRHQNIVTCFNLGMDETKIYMFMELMKTSIANIVKVQLLGENQARAVTSDILDGLIYLHGQGIVHKDIKGDNVLLNACGIAKLADFGISRYYSGGTAMAATGGIAGTPFYLSPEVLNGGEHGMRSDVWAIGCTVFEMVTGKPPLAELPEITAALKTLAFEQKNYVDLLYVGPQLKDFLQTIFVTFKWRPFAQVLRCHDWLDGAMERIIFPVV